MSSSNINPSKKQKRINPSPDFRSVLLECGISSLVSDAVPSPSVTKTSLLNEHQQLHQHQSTMIATTNDNQKCGCVLEPFVNPSSLRASIDGLLKEMHTNGNDVDNELVLDSMESLIMNGEEYCCREKNSTSRNGDDDDLDNNGAVSSNDNDDNNNDDDGNNFEKKGMKYELLWKMLLPLSMMTTSTDDDDNVESNSNANTTSEITTAVTTSSSSLMKVLLRIDVLQPTLITCLFCKLQEIAIIEQDEEDLLFGMKAAQSTKKSSLDFFTMINEIPRLVLNHIRWMDHIIKPKVLTQAALECLTMLCSMSGAANNDDDNDDDSKNNRGNNANRHIKRTRIDMTSKNGNNVRRTLGRENNDSICKSILLDLIATLPDIIDEDISSFKTRNNEEEKMDEGNDDDKSNDSDDDDDEDVMTMILSTLRDVRVQDPTLLIPCLDAVSSLRLTTPEQMESVIDDALEAIESVEESWLLPALCKFLMQNVPRGSSGFGGGGSNSQGNISKNLELIQKVIGSLRRLRLGQDHIIDTDQDKDEREYKNQIQSNSDSEALMIEALSQGFAYRSDLTNALFQDIKNSTSSSGSNEAQNHGPCDIWLLLCCAQAPHNKSKVKSLFKSKAVSAAFTADLIKDAIRGNTIALQSLFESSMLYIADALLRSNEMLARNLGAVFYEVVFTEFDNRMCRQDLIGQLVIHINSGSYDEVDVAMKVLMNISSSGVEGITSLRMFLPFLTSLLDNVRNFHSQHLRRLFLLLFVVGMDGLYVDEGDARMGGTVGGGSGCDEVHIVIRKYLALPQIAMKQIVSTILCFHFYCEKHFTSTSTFLYAYRVSLERFALLQLVRMLVLTKCSSKTPS